MNTRTISFTESEAQAVLKLLDLAVKQGGLGVANAGLLIAKKFEDAFNQPPLEAVQSILTTQHTS